MLKNDNPVNIRVLHFQPFFFFTIIFTYLLYRKSAEIKNK